MSRRDKNPDWFKEDSQELFALLAGGKLRPAIDRTIGFEQIVEAHELIERAAVRGRIVLRMPTN